MQSCVIILCHRISVIRIDATFVFAGMMNFYLWIWHHTAVLEVRPHYSVHNIRLAGEHLGSVTVLLVQRTGPQPVIATYQTFIVR
jgi:hypothetical protein